MDLTSAEWQRPDLPAPGEDLPEIVRLYRSGMTLKEVASSVGMSVSAVYSRVRPYGTRRPCGPKLKVRIDLADIERMYRAGRTLAAVARELGVSDSFVYRTLKARRVPIRRPSTTLRAKSAPRRHEALRLHAEGRCYREIAAELDISPSTVFKWIKRDVGGIITAPEQRENGQEPIRSFG